MVQIPNDVVKIEYPFSWGGSFHDRRFWQATLNGEVLDFHLPEVLIADAEKEGSKWVMIRHHKDGTSSIIKHSDDYKELQ